MPTYPAAARDVLLVLLMTAPAASTPAPLLAAATPDVNIRYGVRDLTNTETFNLAPETSEFQSSDWLNFILVEWTAVAPTDTIEVRAVGPDGSVPYQTQQRTKGRGPRKDWFFFPILGTPAEKEMGNWNGQVLINGVAVPARVHFKVVPGDYHKALTQAQALAKRYPKFVDPVYMIGALQAALGQSREARQSLNTAIKVAPAYVWPHMALARLMKQGGELIPAANEIALARRLNQGAQTSLSAYVGVLLDAMSR